MPRVRHHTDIEGLRGIRTDNAIIAGRGDPPGVHVAVLEIELIASMRITKDQVVLLFCFFRQAERSVDHALSSPTQWSDFLRYYDPSKRCLLSELLKSLDHEFVVAGHPSKEPILLNNVFLSTIVVILGLIVNRFKSTWKFSAREVAMFSSSLGKLQEILDGSDFPGSASLIDCRVRCWKCQFIMTCKLAGLDEIRKASDIEHFNQADFRRHFSYEEILPTKTSSRSEMLAKT